MLGACFFLDDFKLRKPRSSFICSKPAREGVGEGERERERERHRERERGGARETERERERGRGMQILMRTVLFLLGCVSKEDVRQMPIVQLAPTFLFAGKSPLGNKLYSRPNEPAVNYKYVLGIFSDNGLKFRGDG